MKNKVMVLLVTLVMLIGIILPSTVSAQKINNTLIASRNIDENTETYAENILPIHLHGLLEAAELHGNVYDYNLGAGFSIFNVISSTESVCFPVIQNGNIVAILEVYYDGKEFTSSLAISFAKELTQILNTSHSEKIIFITDGVSLQVYDGNKSYEIYKQFDNSKVVEDLSEHLQFDYKSLPSIRGNELSEARISSYTVLRGIGGPTAYKTLSVRGVSQSGDTCWAATCAAIINYLRGTQLSAIDVAKYVFGDNWDQGGGWSHMKDAYNHWGLYPSETGRISFDSVISQINRGGPMHLGLYDHSVGLIGYEDWRGSPDGHNERILILLEPNGGVLKSVKLNSNGNFYYKLGKGSYTWVKTRRF